MNRFLCCSALTITLLFAPGKGATAQDDEKGRKVFEQGLKSSVWVVNIIPNVGVASGSGSLIDYKQRLVVTNYHVVTTSPTVQIMFPMFDANGKRVTDKKEYLSKMLNKMGYVGKVLLAQKKRDLAIVQLIGTKPYPKGTVAIELTNDEPSPGDSVHSIGSPSDSGGLFSYTPGSCKNVFQQKWYVGGAADGFEVDCRVIETSSPTNHGDSGGPLMNDKGQQIGVTEGGSGKAQNISWFIPTSEIHGILKDLKITLSSYRGPGTNTGKDEDEAKSTDPKTLKESPDLKDPMASPKKDDTADRPKASEKDEKDAKSFLGIAKTQLESGNKDLARKYINKILTNYPTTASAREAKELLKELDK